MTSSIIIGIRTKCYEQFLIINPEKARYFKELEARIYNISGQPQTHQQILSVYYRKYTQLYYNLKLFCNELTSRYKPSELVYLSEEDLNKNVKAEREHNVEQHRLYKKILEQGIDMENDDQDDDANPDESFATNVCSRCKNSKNLTIIPRQLRGGDEAMSLLITCNKCGKHWRVG